MKTSLLEFLSRKFVPCSKCTLCKKRFTYDADGVPKLVGIFCMMSGARLSANGEELAEGCGCTFGNKRTTKVKPQKIIIRREVINEQTQSKT